MKNLILKSFTEKHSYSEQVIITEKLIVGGIHGAALTNMLYMEKNSNVLELRDANDYNNLLLTSIIAENNFIIYYVGDNGGNSTVNYDDLENLLE